jgi:cob(I)alamin adenosyltransferase
MLYTRKGDDGLTKIFGCDQSLSKSSKIAEALGALDETNSYLGLCKVKAGELAGDLDQIQQDLFIIQAEIAGADKHLIPEKIAALEKIVDGVEKQLPPISTFFVAGGVELSALFDHARTIARRAERRVVAVAEEGMQVVSRETIAYLNRLSSVLYAWARLANEQAGVTEETPHY